MNMGGYKTVCLGNPLARQNRIPFFDQGLRGLSDVLLKRKNHFPFRIERTQPCFPAQLLALLRVGTAAKSIFQCLPDSFP